MIHTFEIGKNDFLLDGKPFRIIAGAMHYFRVPREYWKDRLLKLRACGFNTVETYIAWNMHEKEEGIFDFSGMLDIEEYLQLAQELGLYAIVRPGPYICSEWDFGGLPWWLNRYDDIELRCMDKTYLEKTDRFYDELFRRLVPHQISKGGNIILIQNENEYGSYGDDSEYLKYMADGLRKRGVDIPLFTSDGGEYQMLTAGTLPEIHKTVNFGSNPEKNFEILRKYQSDGPLMCAEYWNGWFDHWGEKHHSRNPEDAAACLDEILSSGASISCYMFHGGTNFGFMNGANHYEEFEPTVSSYDDDAPLNENGEPTEKYFLFRDIISKYNKTDYELPEIIKPQEFGEVKFTRSADLLDNLENISSPIPCIAPRAMEKYGQGYGFILYSSFIKGPRQEQTLHFDDLHDRAYVFSNNNFIGRQYINDKEEHIRFSVPDTGTRLDILVENMGRTNYGRHLRDRKGITKSIGADNNTFFHWNVYNLPLDNIDKLRFKEIIPEFNGTPLFLEGDFYVDDPKDTFVKLPGFTKGIIFINGFILSRYWNIGPQKSAYLPAPFMKKGKNVLTVFELEGFENAKAILDNEPDLG